MSMQLHAGCLAGIWRRKFKRVRDEANAITA